MSQASFIADRALRPCPTNCCTPRGCDCEAARVEAQISAIIIDDVAFLQSTAATDGVYDVNKIIPFNTLDLIVGNVSIVPLPSQPGIIEVPKGTYDVSFEISFYVSLPASSTPPAPPPLFNDMYFDFYVNQLQLPHSRVGLRGPVSITDNLFQVTGRTLVKATGPVTQIAVQFASNGVQIGMLATNHPPTSGEIRPPLPNMTVVRLGN